MQRPNEQTAPRTRCPGRAGPDHCHPGKPPATPPPLPAPGPAAPQPPPSRLGTGRGNIVRPPPRLRVPDLPHPRDPGWSGERPPRPALTRGTGSRHLESWAAPTGPGSSTSSRAATGTKRSLRHQRRGAAILPQRASAERASPLPGLGGRACPLRGVTAAGVGDGNGGGASLHVVFMRHHNLMRQRYDVPLGAGSVDVLSGVGLLRPHQGLQAPTQYCLILVVS